MSFSNFSSYKVLTLLFLGIWACSESKTTSTELENELSTAEADSVLAFLDHNVKNLPSPKSAIPAKKRVSLQAARQIVITETLNMDSICEAYQAQNPKPTEADTLIYEADIPDEGHIHSTIFRLNLSKIPIPFCQGVDSYIKILNVFTPTDFSLVLYQTELDSFLPESEDDKTLWSHERYQFKSGFTLATDTIYGEPKEDELETLHFVYKALPYLIQPEDNGPSWGNQDYLWAHVLTKNKQAFGWMSVKTSSETAFYTLQGREVKSLIP